MKDTFDPERRFNDRAPFYDQSVDKIIPGYRALHDSARHLLNVLLGPEAKVLVAGSGTGNEAVNWALDNPRWTIAGFDIAREMINVADEKTERLWLEGRVSFTQGKAGDIYEESFDAASSLLVMHFMDPAEKADFLLELWLRLKPGGVLILADITGERDTREFKTYLSAFESFQLLTREKEDVEKTLGHLRDGLPIITSSETLSLIEESGFKSSRLFHKSLLIEGYIAEKTLD